MRRTQSTLRHEEIPDIASVPPAFAENCVERVLGTVRSRLGMDVAFVTEFIGDTRFFRHVNTKTGRSPIKAGDFAALEDGYCKKIVEGRLPELIPDTAAVPEAMAIAATRGMRIGSHMGVPLRLGDGRIFGAFCCFSYDAGPTLSERDLLMMKAFADVVVYEIDRDSETVRSRAEKTERIQAALQSDEPSIVYQPVFRLSDMSVVAAEALARFAGEPARSPDKWFAEAGEVGLKTDLELKAIRGALAKYRSLWRRGPIYLGINSSSQTMTKGISEALEGFPAERIVIEITEHDHVENYDELLQALAPLRARGVKIAVDDAGSGYASMRHILNIQPDFIKLDTSLTHGIDVDGMRRALAKALIEFGRETDCKIVAEGLETEAELKTLKDLGVHAAQGWLLGRPLPIEDLWRVLIPNGLNHNYNPRPRNWNPKRLAGSATI